MKTLSVKPKELAANFHQLEIGGRLHVVIVNPSPQQISSLFWGKMHDGARSVLDPQHNLYMWDAETLTHAAVIRHFQLPRSCLASASYFSTPKAAIARAAYYAHARTQTAKPSPYSDTWVDRILPLAERLQKKTKDAVRALIQRNNLPDNLVDAVLDSICYRLGIKTTAADSGWIGVDLDGTLAVHNSGEPFDINHIGDPIPLMVDRVKRALSEGKTVKIFTARAADPKFDLQAFSEWCVQNVGQALDVTNEKDSMMIELWDDRAVPVERNTGEIKMKRVTEMSRLPSSRQVLLASIQLAEQGSYQHSVLASNDFAVKKVIKEMKLGTFVKQRVLMDGSEWQCPDFEVERAFNSRGQYIGDWAFANYLHKECIDPELASPDHSVCSIGFCEQDQTWAGWSHRALAKFGIGDRVFDPDFGDDNTPFIQHGVEEITTLEQARAAAVNFAEYVS